MTPETQPPVVAAPQTFTVVDPRTFDGNPYEVAGRSARQVASIVALARRTLPATELMLRNAEMERNLSRGQDPGAKEWPDTVQAKVLAALVEQLAVIERQFQSLARAGEFDPKHPPKA